MGAKRPSPRQDGESRPKLPPLQPPPMARSSVAPDQAASPPTQEQVTTSPPATSQSVPTPSKVTSVAAEAAAQERRRCPRCGSTDLGRGYLVEHGHKFRQVRFAVAGLPLWRLSWFLRPWRALIKVEAEVCRSCGAITLLVDPDELARLERRFGG